MCKTNPIWTGSPGTGETERAKQSQFGPDGQERARPLGVERAKQSQFLGGGTEGKYFEGKELW